MYNTLAILEAVKKDITEGNYHVSPARYGAITDEIIRIKEELAKKAAKASGKTNLLKACKSILKAANKGYNRALHGVTTINGTSYVCDGHRLIAFPAGAVDLPVIPEGVKPLEFEKIVARPAETSELVPVPDAAELASKIKQIKAAEKAAGRRPARYLYRLENMYINAEYLLDALSATGAEYAEVFGRVKPIHLEKDGVKAVVLPVSPQTVTVKILPGEIAAIY